MNPRALLHYGLSTVILTLYGGQVCPFLESLSAWVLLGILSTGFLIAYCVRYLVLESRIHGNSTPGMSLRRFPTEFLLFAGTGAIIGIYNFLYYGFPWGSCIKLLIGCASLGFFFSLDLVLEHEYRLVKNMLEKGLRLQLHKIRRSLARTFTWVAIAGVTGAISVLLLVLNKDMDWLLTFGPDRLAFARDAIWSEILFVGLVLLAQLILVILSYSRNLKIFFDNETSVLEAVARGSLDRYVPVSTNDEFGLIATRTNQMIDGLRERNRIKNLFGKFLDPKIAEVLLAQGEEELKPGGSKRDLAILVSDVRDFTSVSEKLAPEQVVLDLNRYFSRMVEIVHGNHGIVDKFLGDGILVYFGIQDPASAVAQALRCAIQMQQAIGEIQSELAIPFRIGIGIHAGEVIAGKIGSSERLEFTVIGDVVNTATRLEGLCKESNMAILVSSNVLDRLSEKHKSIPWIPMGEPRLKGKEKAVKVYGINHADLLSVSID
ncbi:MAG: adenylate/guanylate cyclase domain-containing protein [Methylococcales bacterium]